MFKSLSLALHVKHLKRSVNELDRLPLSVFHDGLERRETAYVHTYWKILLINKMGKSVLLSYDLPFYM